MPQWRKLHTKTIDSLDLNDMPDDFTRLLWVLLPLQLDRCGRGLDNPAWVRSKVFPLRQDVSVEMVAKAFNWYESRGMIERYEAKGRRYFWIPTWHKYQGKTNREADSDFPAPESYSDPSDDSAKDKTSSRPAQDQLKSRFRLDVDVDVDADRDTDKEVEVDVDRSDDNPFALYEQATASTLTPILAERIGDMVDECEDHRRKLPLQASGASVTGAQWVCHAIREAAESTNKFGLRYVGAILDRWREQGYDSRYGVNGREPPKPRKRTIRPIMPDGSMPEVEAIA